MRPGCKDRMFNKEAFVRSMFFAENLRRNRCPVRSQEPRRGCADASGVAVWLPVERLQTCVRVGGLGFSVSAVAGRIFGNSATAVSFGSLV